MFTGIVTAQGTLVQRHEREAALQLSFRSPYDDLRIGESVAINGACLTVIETHDGAFTVDAVTTTRDRTTFGDLRVGDTVNLERALALGERLGGHLVSGHVDGVAEVIRVRDEADARLVDLKVPPAVATVSVEHGSITVDGVSMTINALPAPETVQISVIPYTRDHTTLGRLSVGDRAHVEGDMIGKFVARLVEVRNQGTS